MENNTLYRISITVEFNVKAMTFTLLLRKKEKNNGKKLQIHQKITVKFLYLPLMKNTFTLFEQTKAKPQGSIGPKLLKTMEFISFEGPLVVEKTD